MTELTVDVPDLPTSVNDYYSTDELPADIPDGAAVFTIRKRTGFVIPEPDTLSAICIGLIGLALARRWIAQLNLPT